MDFLEWLRNVGERVWSFFAEPFHQSLILICLTVFVLGAQLAIACGDAIVGLVPAYVILLVFYLVKNLGILLKEIKETSNDGPKDPPPTDG